MLSRMVKCIDPELFREWLDAYVAVESENTDEEDEEDEVDTSPQPRPKPKRLPDYLRAIETHTEEQDDGQAEEASRNDGS
jgi:hypothetical protein